MQSPPSGVEPDLRDERRPFAYGYLRLVDDLSALPEPTVEQAMRDLAASHGLRLHYYFFESRTGTRDGLYGFICALQATKVRHVIVPSFDHLAENGPLLDSYLDRLRRVANAAVLSVAD